MDKSYTPGPWTVRPVAGGHAKGCFQVTIHNGSFASRDRHNSRLIAAAPEMLEALDAVITAGNPSATALQSKARRMALAAVAKARGEDERVNPS